MSPVVAALRRITTEDLLCVLAVLVAIPLPVAILAILVRP